MLRFDNVSHRKALQDIGVLHPLEVELRAEEVVHRSIYVQNLQIAIDIVKQEMAHHVTNYSHIGETLELAFVQATSIVDNNTLHEAQDTLEAIEHVLRNAGTQIQGIRHSFLL